MSVTHKIHRQILDLQLSEKKDAFSLQTQFRDLYFDELLPLIEAELNRLSPGDEVIVIDRLELDLGKVIQNGSLDQTMKERLVKALEEQFFPIHHARKEGKHKGTFRLVSSGDEVEWRKEAQGLTIFESFISFLETGVIPWGTVVKSSDDLSGNSTSRVHALIEEILELKSHELVEYIKRNAGYTRVQQRIYNHFTVEQIRTLVSQSVAKDLELTITQLHELMKEIALMAGATLVLNSRQEKAIWWSFYLIVSGIQAQSIRMNAILPLFITLIKQEFGFSNVSLVHFFTFIEKQPQNAKQLIDFSTKMGVNVPETMKKIRQLSRKTEVSPIQNDQTLSKLLEMRKNVFQLQEILPIIDNDWFLEWNEVLQTKHDEKIDRSKIEHFKIQDSRKKDENSASKLVDENGISVENAGLVFLAYFLPHLFKHLGWLDDKSIRDEALPKALSMTQFLVTGEEIVDESALVLNKLMLGIDLDDPITNDYVLTNEEKELGIDLLRNVIKSWEALRSVSIPGFQHTFLKRDGIVYFRDNQYLLRVEKKTVDILMEKIPWSIGVIKLSWMPKMMITEW